MNFIVQKKGKKKAVFSWDPVAGAAGYEVAQADSQKGKYTTIWQQKKKTSVELKISKDKYYKVRAWYKKDGELIIKILQNKWAATEEVAACFMENTQKAYSEFDGDI